MARYQNVIVQIVSDSSLNLKEDLVQLLNDTTATNSLGGVFFATMVRFLVFFRRCFFNSHWILFV